MELQEEELDIVTVAVTVTETPERAVPELSGEEPAEGSRVQPLLRKNWVKRKTSNRNLILQIAAAVESHHLNLVKVSSFSYFLSITIELVGWNIELGKQKFPSWYKVYLLKHWKEAFQWNFIYVCLHIKIKVVILFLLRKLMSKCHIKWRQLLKSTS